MKTLACFLIYVSIGLPIFSQDLLDQKGKNKQSQLLKEDSERKAKILEKYNAFYQKWKTRYPGLDFKTLPMEPSLAKDIFEHNSAPEPNLPVLPIISAFMSEDFILRREPNFKPAQQSDDKVQKGEAIELVFILKNDPGEKIDSPIWALIRKKNGREGYVPIQFVVKEANGMDEDFETRLNRTKVKVEPTESEDSFSPNFDKQPGRQSIKPQASASNLNIDKEQAVANYFQIPLENSRYVSSAFGVRIDPVTGKPGSFHSGIDMPAPVGTPIQAVADGKVWKLITTSGGYGMLTILSHKNDIYTYYAHQRIRRVSEGSLVKSGEKIGEVGLTGKTTGAHLHFEVRKGTNKEALDPKVFLPR